MTAPGTVQRIVEPESLADPRMTARLLELTAIDLLRSGADREGRLLIAGEADISVRELVDLADTRARGLVWAGFSPGDRLALWLPSCLDLVAWTWAAMFAGGSAVPLSSRSPELEVRRYAAMAGAWKVISSKPAEGFLDVAKARRVLRPGGGVELPGATPDDEAACFTTSGSTGTSKLSIMLHRSFAAQLAAYQALIAGGPGETVMHPMPLAHVASVAQVYLMLAQGRTVVVLPDFDAGAVVELAREHQVSFISGTPTMWALILDRTSLPDRRVKLRRVTYAAAPMPSAWAQRLGEALQCELVHAYGLTEAGTLTGLPPEKVLKKAGSAGGVIAPDTELTIRDPATGDALGPGEVGEICVRGPGVSPGYVNMPEETADLLRGGWMHTGDLGRLDGDGDLWVTGRIKDQINRGGLKIGAREVEEAIETVAGVVAAGVVGVPDDVLGERIAAVVEISDPAVDADSIRRAVAERLADYKVPQQVLCVGELPRNAMKKVDKPAIRALLEKTAKE